MWFYFGSWLDSSVDSAIPMFYLSYSSSIASSLKWNFLTCSVYRKILGIMNSRERREPLRLHLIFSSYILNSLSSPQFLHMCLTSFSSPFSFSFPQHLSGIVLSIPFPLHFIFFRVLWKYLVFSASVISYSFQTRD